MMSSTSIPSMLYGLQLAKLAKMWKRADVDLCGEQEPGSLFHAVSHMLRSRKKHPSFGTGTLYWINCEEKAIAAYVRSTSFDKMLCVSNLSSRHLEADINIPRGAIPPASEGDNPEHSHPHELGLIGDSRAPTLLFLVFLLFTNLIHGV